MEGGGLPAVRARVSGPGPGPSGDGDVTHVHTDAGGVTTTVAAHWRATGALAGAGGPLAELPTPTAAPLALPVRERPVVTRQPGRAVAGGG